MLKEYLEKFDKSLEEPKKESSKSQLKEYIEKFDESLGEPIEESPMPHSYTPTNEKMSTFAPIEQLQNEIQDKDTIIEDLKNESIKLKKQVSIAEKNESIISEELRKSKWLENKVTLATKKVYEDKIQSVINENIDSKLIPVLTSAARIKQGNQQLNWGKWLKIPENKYLYEVNKDIAKGIFEDTNALIGRKNEEVRGGGVIEALDKNNVLTFTGNTAAGARSDYVSTTFNPDSYDGAGTGLNRGFTVSYWVKSLEELSGSPDVFLAWGKRSQVGSSFQFGVRNANKIKIGVGSADKDDNTHKAGLGWEAGDDNVAHGVNDGEWHHWTVTYGGDDHSSIGGDRQVRVYLDGVEILKNNASGGGMGTANWEPGKQNNGIEDAVNAASYIYFGGRANWNGLDDDPPTTYNQGWACALSEVAIYNVEKDEDGTFANVVYNAGWGYNHEGNSGLVGYWKFNEGSGTTVKDYGPYGKHGTLTSDTNQGGSGTPTWEEIENYR